MKLGTIFPGAALGRDVNAIKDFVQALEGLGYDYLVTYEELMTDGNPKALVHEAFTLFSYLAAVTQKLEFATGIMVLPKRPTVLVAKQAAELDILSGGRFRYGVSVGWKEGEYQALGVDFRTRGQCIEGQIAVLRELWTKPAVTFRGDFHTIDGLGINPLPVQRPIPIWMGGWADVVLRRAARMADGWMATLPPDQFKDAVIKLRAYLKEAGRDLTSFGISNHVYVAETPESEWGGLLEEWRDLGVTHVEYSLMGAGVMILEERVEALRHFKAQVKKYVSD